MIAISTRAVAAFVCVLLCTSCCPRRERSEFFMPTYLRLRLVESCSRLHLCRKAQFVWAVLVEARVDEAVLDGALHAIDGDGVGAFFGAIQKPL